GYMWDGLDGEPTTDVGANLLRRLELTGTPWTPLLRTNRHNPHPVFFAVYGDAVYHHGAGFRWPVVRVDWAGASAIPAAALPLLGPITRRIARMQKQAQYRRLARRNRRLSEEMLGLIERDDPGWLDRLT